MTIKPWLAGALLLLAACSQAIDNEATPITRERNQNIADSNIYKSADMLWPLSQKGLIAKANGQVYDEEGEVVWDFDSFNFLEGEAPDVVNPNLWEQARLNNQPGLYEVRDRVYQIRGFDLSNMTLIEGKTGWIIIDTLTSQEVAQYAMQFVKEHLGEKPVKAIVFTHSHVDHFGGALAIATPEEVKKNGIKVVAPAGFMHEATSENIMVGPAMGRRSSYMYGKFLERSPRGLVGNGLGKAVAYGTIGILAPNVEVVQPREKIKLDGVLFEFMNVPGSEAPSEFVFNVPELKLFGAAELFSHTLHNLYTLRGAKVRDSLRWVDYMTQAIEMSKDSEVMVFQHNWPVWGKEEIADFAKKQRDVYKFIHDQTVRLINAGYTPNEIAEQVKMPAELETFFSGRGFYGTLSHNIKAVYQFYMGWYDANPANLNAIEPVEAAKRYVKLAGGMESLVEAAQEAYDRGDYRWASELLKHAVYADPNYEPARTLQAKSFEQMGYVAESGPWRNVYLSAARELRGAEPERSIDRAKILGLLNQTPLERFFEVMGASLNAEKAEGVNLTVNFNFSDLKKNYVLKVNRSVLYFEEAPQSEQATATLSLTKPFFLRMMVGDAGPLALLLSSETDIEGSLTDLRVFFSMLDRAEGDFPIVTP